MYLHQKHFLRFLLFFYLFSSFVSASHIHHEADSSHDNCSVCIVVKNLHSGDTTPSFALEKIIYLHENILSFVAQYTHYIHTKYVHSQAPPLFS